MILIMINDWWNDINGNDDDNDINDDDDVLMKWY